MKARYLISSCLFVLTALVLGADLPARAANVIATQEESFVDRFRKALAAGDEAAMEALVASNATAAAAEVVVVCEKIGEANSEKLERELDAYRTAWKAAIGTRFVDSQYEFFSLMRADYRRARKTLKGQFVNELAKFEEAVAEERFVGLPGMGASFEGYANGFEEVGDIYFAARSWLLVAWCFDEKYLEDEARLGPAQEAYKKTVDLRKRMGLEDPLTTEAKARLAVLEDAGVGAEGVEIIGGLANQAVEAGAPMPLRASFEVVADITSVRRPIYSADENYQVWTEIFLGKKESTAKFGAIEDSPTIIRSGASAAMVDVDGDGEGDVEIPITGNIMPVEFTLGSGDSARSWAFLATVGQTRDQFQGFDYNLEPDTNQLRLFVAPAASMVGLVGETRVQIFDDNMDGRYGSDPVYWPVAGVIPDSFQVDLDSVLVGKSKVAVPWSEYQNVDDQWYRFEGNETGTEISATLVDVPTGTIKLAYKGGKPDYLVVKGSGKYKNCYFDLIPGGKKGTAVPAGRYTLLCGRISKGKRRQMSKAFILPGEKALSWKVDAGKSVDAEMGAPFGFDFEVRQDDGNATIVGSTIVVTGAEGETYQRLWNCVTKPEAALRKVGTRKGGKGEKMKIPETQDDLLTSGSAAAWHPYDLTLPKKTSGVDVEVQLVEKKNALFGKIESEWRK